MPAPSAVATERAHARVASVDRAVDSARSSWRRVGAAMRIAAFQQFRDTGGHRSSVLASASGLQSAILDAMVAAHLRARFDVFHNAAIGVSKRLGAVDDAVDYFHRRLKLDEMDVRRLRDVYGPESINVANDLTDYANNRLAEVMAQSIAEGDHVDAGIERLREAFDGLGITDKSDHALETLFRTQTQVAYSAGEWNAFQDPDVAEIIWGYEYTTVGDDRVREEHAALEGTRLPKDDPRWDEIWPPNGWNCRCSVVPIFWTDAEAEGLVEPKPVSIGGRMITPGADEGWDFNAGQVFIDSLPQPTIQTNSIITDDPLHGTRGQDRVILGLHLMGGAGKQRDLCARICRTQGPVSLAINSAAEAGLVDHEPAEHRCSLTDDGTAQALRLIERARWRREVAECC